LSTGRAAEAFATAAAGICLDGAEPIGFDCDDDGVGAPDGIAPDTGGEGFEEAAAALDGWACVVGAGLSVVAGGGASETERTTPRGAIGPFF